MKKRLISVGVGLILLAAVLIWFDTLLPNAVLAIIGAIAVFEIIRAYKLNKNILLAVFFISFTVCSVFFELAPKPYFSAIMALLIFLALVTVMLSTKTKHTVAETGGALLMTLVVTVGLNAMLYIRTFTPYAGDWRFMLFIGLALGWICDTCAFFTGRAWGKKKLCPEISPNKTVAGALGGIIGTPIFIAASFFIYSALNGLTAFKDFSNSVWQVVFIFIMGALGAVVGILGDLAASYVKRECGIKDFGNIMPGHGGAMDRIDSVLFTCSFAAVCMDIYFKLFIAF